MKISHFLYSSVIKICIYQIIIKMLCSVTVGQLTSSLMHLQNLETSSNQWPPILENCLF